MCTTMIPIFLYRITSRIIPYINYILCIDEYDNNYFYVKERRKNVYDEELEEIISYPRDNDSDNDILTLYPDVAKEDICVDIEEETKCENVKIDIDHVYERSISPTSPSSPVSPEADYDLV
jgi:hypothetical protein